MDPGEGRPSWWNTLRATRVLELYKQAQRSASVEESTVDAASTEA